jgi:multicomponent Na+:H+ antiporter subunit D
LLFASAGVFHHAGIKIPYFAFFAHDSGKRCAEAPGNMLTAMAIAAAFCIGIGSFPSLFYSLLPFQVEYKPYSLDHVVGQVQLLFLSALAFTLLMRTGVYPPELRSINLDVDWFYRKPGRQIATGVGLVAERGWNLIASTGSQIRSGAVSAIERYHGPAGILARARPTSAMAFWTVVMLAAYLLLSYL